jgi:hypothetical protein
MNACNMTFSIVHQGLSLDALRQWILQLDFCGWCVTLWTFCCIENNDVNSKESVSVLRFELLDAALGCCLVMYPVSSNNVLSVIKRNALGSTGVS